MNFLSLKTVANSLSMIVGKLRVAHRAAAIIKACDASLGDTSSGPDRPG